MCNPYILPLLVTKVLDNDLRYLYHVILSSSDVNFKASVITYYHFWIKSGVSEKTFKNILKIYPLRSPVLNSVQYWKPSWISNPHKNIGF
jgi:hypothetical protein